MAAYERESSLQLQQVVLPGGVDLLCDVSTPVPRPVVPRSWVQLVFDCVHGLSHQGSNATVADVKRRFVWSRVSADVRRLCRLCVPCQLSKVTRHTRAPLQDLPLQDLPLPSRRFQVLNLDLGGSLPSSEGQAYLLTVIDRFSRWVEAFPLPDITASSCATAFLWGWIARFGVPSQIITDQGRQFTSGLWRDTMALLGVSPVLTTSYHPQSNGMIERVHRTLKERLMFCAASSSAPSSSWMDHLPLVLLGLRTTVREDAGCCPADVVFGEQLRLPGDFIDSSSSVVPSADSAFAATLQRSLRGSRPILPVRRGPPLVGHVPPALATVSHVFLRVDAVRRPLTPPYIGPFLVLERGPKTFKISKAGKEVTVSIDRLKPAFLTPVLPSRSAPVPRPPAAEVGDAQNLAPVPSNVPVPLFTSSGRRVRPPDRF